MNDMRERLIELLMNSEVFNDADGKADAKCLAGHLIENGVTVQEWISVKDRLPDDENQRVLAVCVGDYPIGHPRIDTDRYTRGHWVRYGNDVTHWMPLPPAPKGE